MCSFCIPRSVMTVTHELFRSAPGIDKISASHSAAFVVLYFSTSVCDMSVLLTASDIRVRLRL